MNAGRVDEPNRPDNVPLLELEIGPVAHGGWCVARHEGRVVFVRHALPGERVLARVVEESSRFLRADAVEVVVPSPDRVRPPCRYAGPGGCGGCDWQHATPEAQRRLKAAVVEEQLRRIAGIDRAVTVHALPGDGLGWRTRVQYAVRSDGRVGFHRHRSRQIQPIEECLIAHPEIERLGVERRTWTRTDRVEVSVSAATGDRLVHVEGPGRQLRVPRLDAPVRVVRGKPAPGPALPYVRERAAGRTWRVSGGGFWQVHPAAADVLAGAVLDALRPVEGDTVIDLYCGVGLFAGVLGERVGARGSVLGIEVDAISARDARHNLGDLPWVRIERGRVEQILGRLIAEPAFDDAAVAAADLVVLDPPRAGIGRGIVEQVAALAGRARAIAYVSCDPATLARDLRYFGELGWRPADVRAFDAFPMTHHVEIVATLTARERR